MIAGQKRVYGALAYEGRQGLKTCEDPTKREDLTMHEDLTTRDGALRTP